MDEDVLTINSLANKEERKAKELTFVNPFLHVYQHNLNLESSVLFDWMFSSAFL